MSLLRRSTVFLAVVCFLAVCHVSVDGAAAAGPRTTAATRLKKTQSAPAAKTVVNQSDRQEEDPENVGSLMACTKPGYYVYGPASTSPGSVVCPNSGVFGEAGNANAVCCPCSAAKTFTGSSSCSVAFGTTNEGQCCRTCGTSANYLNVGYSPALGANTIVPITGALNSHCPCAGGFGGGTFTFASKTDCSACPANTIAPVNPGADGRHASGSRACVACENGFKPNAARTVCEPIVCTLDQYLDTSVKPNVCRTCGAGTTSRASGDVQQLRCPCQAGFGGFILSGVGAGTCSACTNVNGFSAGGVGATCGLCSTSSTDGPTTGTKSSCRCKPGYGDLKLTSGTTYDCTACASGFFSVGFPMTTCRDCTANNPGEGATPTNAVASVLPTGSSQCVCKGGYAAFARVGADTASAAYTCSICPAGTYSEVTPAAPTGVCSSCPQFTFNPTAGFQGIESCKECLTATSTGASTCQDDCSETDPALNDQCCPAGRKVYMISAGVYGCTACEAGTHTFGASNSRSICDNCPAGKWSIPISATIGAATCTDCQPGFASSDPKQDCSLEQFKCDASKGYYSDVAAPACSQCTAENGGGVAQSVPVPGCFACAEGLRASLDHGSCIDCAPGTYSNSPNKATTCSDCGIGEYSGPRALTCDTCLKGKYSNVAGTDCLDCPAGTDTEEKSGRDETQPPACTDCRLGTFKPSASADSCAACGAGSVPALASKATSCVQCGPGTYADSSSTDPSFTCKVCPAGSVSNGAANAECTPCSAGEYASTALNRCVPCPDGGFFSTTPETDKCQRCPTNSKPRKLNPTKTSEAGACEQCAPQTYAIHPIDPMAPATAECSPCGVNQFFPTEGAACTDCEAGQQSVDRENAVTADRATACTVCPAGTTSVAGGSCTTCLAGTFSFGTDPAVLNTLGSNDNGLIRLCKTCPVGSVFTATQGSADDCKECDSNGEYFVAADKNCEVCSIGFVTSTTIAGVRSGCQACAKNSFFKGYGTSQSESCQDCGTFEVSTGGIAPCGLCPEGQEKNAAGDCSACPAGTFRAAGTNGPCTKCPTGTWSSSGAKVCTACGNGQRWTAEVEMGALPMSSTFACRSCEAGHVSDADTWNESKGNEGYTCTKCSQPGQYAEFGANLKTCRDCAAPNWVPEPRSTCVSCNPNEEAFVQSGPLTVDNYCTVCSENKKSTGGPTCTLCPAGEEKSLVTAGQCSPCAIGFFRGSANDDFACKPCTANFYCPSTRTITPTPCAGGSYAPEGSDAAADCTACPKNNYVDDFGVCKKCPAGSYGEGGLAPCVLCEAGRAGRFTEGSAQQDGAGCVDCLGTLARYSGEPTKEAPNLFCRQCLRGSTVNVEGPATECNECPAGSYHAASLSLTCTLCSPGQSTNGKKGQTSCSRCDSGTYAPAGTGECTPCGAGRWASPISSTATAGAFSDTACKACPVGRFSSAVPNVNPGTELDACTECPAGRYGPTTGAGSCPTLCPKGTSSVAGVSACTTCGVGRSAPAPGQAGIDCAPCATGRYQAATGGTDPFLTTLGLSSNTMAAANSAGSLTFTATVYPIVAETTGKFTFLSGDGVLPGCSVSVSKTCTISFADLDLVGGLTHSITVKYTPNSETAYEETVSGPIAVTLVNVEGELSVATLGGAVVVQPPPSTEQVPNYASCTLCGLGTFAPSIATRACTNCPAGRVASVEGSIACTRCGQNTFSNAAQGTACTPCQAGTTTYPYAISGSTYVITNTGTNSVTGAPLSGNPAFLPGWTACLNCQPGWAREFAVAEELCGNCALGKFAAGSGAICSPCAAGKFGAPVPPSTGSPVLVNGCKACPNGKFAPTISTLECTDCPKGRAVTNVGEGASICAACIGGEYQDEVGMPTCKKCAAGTFSTLTERTLACDVCPAGKITKLDGLNVCTDCLNFEYQPLPGMSSCMLCPKGTSVSSAATAFTSCSACAIGRFKAEPTAAADTCTVCPAGKFRATPGGDSCQDCPAGTYRAGPPDNLDEAAKIIQAGLAASCVKCPAGRAAINETFIGRTTEDDACRDCPIGTYTFTDSTGMTTCAPCPAGRWSNAAKQTSCIACEQGRYGLLGETGQTVKDWDDKRIDPFTGKPANLTSGLVGACRRCPIGRSSTALALTSDNTETACVPCVKGTYQDQTGQSQCAGCSLGKFSARDVATICADCIPGRYAHQTGLTECFGCDIGKYVDTARAQECLNCKEELGEYAAVMGMSFCHGCFAGRWGKVEGPGSNINGYWSPDTLTSENFFDHNLQIVEGDENSDVKGGFDGGPTGCNKCPAGVISLNQTRFQDTAESYCGSENTPEVPTICGNLLYAESGDTVCGTCGGNRYPPDGTPRNLPAPSPYTWPLDNDGYGECLGCPAGSYGPVDASECTVCKIPGYTTVRGEAQFESDCGPTRPENFCKAGTYWFAKESTCLECPPHQWSGVAHPNATCFDCQANTDRDAGQLTPSDVANPETMCTACTPPLVSEAGGNCALCPVPQSCTELPCRPGIDKYDTAASTDCVPCNDLSNELFAFRFLQSTNGHTDEGYCVYCQDGYGLNQVLQTCEICGHGTYRKAPTFPGALKDTACESCAADYYTMVEGQTDCTNKCAPGEVPTEDGSDCEPCPAGSVESTDGTCTLCTGLQYQPDAGTTECLTANDGFIAVGAIVNEEDSTKSTGNTGVKGCGAGKYRSNEKLQTTCMACPAGTWYYDLDPDNEGQEYDPPQGTGMCTLCPVGTIRETEQSGVCSACEPDKFPNLADNDDPTVIPSTFCDVCGSGERVFEPERKKCEPCPENTYRKADSVEDVGENEGVCIECAENAFAPKPEDENAKGASYCQCKPGFTRRAEDFLDGEQTSQDRAGKHCKPNDCSEGQYLFQVGNVGRCVSCPPGTFCNNPAGCGAACTQCDLRAESQEGAAQCRCKNDGSTYPVPVGDGFGYIPLGSGDQPGLVSDPALLTGNIDNGKACLPACALGHFFLTAQATVDVGAGPQTLEPYVCHPAPKDFFCPKFMTFGCAGASVANALEPCHTNSETVLIDSEGTRTVEFGATSCKCKKSYIDLDGSPDGSGCVLEELVTRR